MKEPRARREASETKVDALLRRRGLSQNQAARLLGCSQTLFKRMRDGRETLLTSAARLVYASGYQVSFEDLIPKAVKLSLQRRYLDAFVVRGPARSTPEVRRRRQAQREKLKAARHARRQPS